MTARILDGASVARAIRQELQPGIAATTAQLGRRPGLGILLAGDNPASEIYVRNKIKASEETGLHAELLRLSSSASRDDLLASVTALNRREDIDGILVQSPLPAGLTAADVQAVFDAIDPAKDVDGFNPLNVGRLVQGRSTFAPCTPAGVIELLDRSDIEIAGAHAVVIGRSDIVGKPMALLLLHRHASVTICHSRTRNLAELSARGDIVVAAVGRAGFLTPEFVRPGATVIDVGINRITDRSMAAALLAGMPERLDEFARRGAAVVGDVHPSVRSVAGALTPVPGGVGPLTIAMLLSNTLKAASFRTERG